MILTYEKGVFKFLRLLCSASKLHEDYFSTSLFVFIPE